METISKLEFEKGIELLYDITDKSLKEFLLEEFKANPTYRNWIIINFKRLYDPLWRVQKRTEVGVLLPTIHDFNGDTITIDNIIYCKASLTTEVFKISGYNNLESYEIDFHKNNDFFHIDLISLPITQKLLSYFKRIK